MQDWLCSNTEITAFLSHSGTRDSKSVTCICYNNRPREKDTSSSKARNFLSSLEFEEVSIVPWRRWWPEMANVKLTKMELQRPRENGLHLWHTFRSSQEKPSLFLWLDHICLISDLLARLPVCDFLPARSMNILAFFPLQRQTCCRNAMMSCCFEASLGSGLWVEVRVSLVEVSRQSS